MNDTSNIRGAVWHRWDPHLHGPGTLRNNQFLGAAAPGLRVMLEQNIVSLTFRDTDARFWLWVYPAFFTSLWLWLYVASGLLLRAARQFDVGFSWFNRRFDIETKPLQSIGLANPSHLGNHR